MWATVTIGLTGFLEEEERPLKMDQITSAQEQNARNVSHRISFFGIP